MNKVICVLASKSADSMVFILNTSRILMTFEKAEEAVEAQND